jgi:UDP-N-acetylmuramoyl-L-alanyl-D-glutamate--2,6-diaminopimelate ligase
MEPGKSLAELGLTAKGGREATVTGIAVDSRKVRPGVLFAALPGSRAHGAEYTATALGLGAGAILTDADGARLAADALKVSTVPVVVATDPREALARAAALWFGAQPETVVAVTGTNGKTSVASFTRQIWAALGHAACNLGTVGVEGAFSAPLAHTTPEPVQLHGLLAEMARSGVTHLAMEASSHGLDQRRLDGVRLAAAGFTNLTRDHLDYHGTMDAYLAAKMGLFTRLLPPDAPAVVNLDDGYGPRVAQDVVRAGLRLVGTGRAAKADIRLMGQRFHATGQEVRISSFGEAYQLKLGLIGGFQAENVLVAAGLAIGAGEEPEAVFTVLPKLVTVRGRMQLAATRENGAAVFVDFAHTPDAVATALRALRPHVMGRIVAVIGAGGDRDKGKRPLMGRAAAEHADVVFVTDDNPRSEVPATIRREVMAGCPGATEVGDRAEAILRAVDTLGAGDALLVMGKGHETGQKIGNVVYPFDDVEQASVAVAALDGRA